MNERRSKMKKAILAAMVVLASVTGGRLSAQPALGVWGGYTYFPPARFSDSDAPQGVKLQVSSWQTGAAFPLSFVGGRTLILNNLTYEVVTIGYDDPSGAIATPIERLHSVTYTLFLIQRLSEKWQLIAVATPGIASDFEGELSGDDVSFTGVLGAKHDFSDRFSLGAGVAYQRNFGDPIPLPFVLVKWAIGPRVALDALLPMNATLLYSPSETFDVGVFAEVGGNEYHGDPKKFGVGNPLLKYSVAAAGPVVQVHVTPWARLTLKGGATFVRRFEFFDGSEEASSFNLDQSWFVQGGLQIGM
jgi:hypothetical protein